MKDILNAFTENSEMKWEKEGTNYRFFEKEQPQHAWIMQTHTELPEDLRFEDL